MFDRLDNLKAVQAAAVLLRQQPERTMSCYVLLKQLYIADRESLKETGFPIIGGNTVAMEGGPLHSVVYNWVRSADVREWLDEHESEGNDLWKKSIATTDRSRIRLEADPGDSELSDYEVSMLEKVACMSPQAARKLVHELPEWKTKWESRGAAGSVPIPWADVLRAVGRGEEVDDINATDAAVRSFWEAVAA